jgi:outer membrane receptor for ferrienterochelin and colicins
MKIMIYRYSDLRYRKEFKSQRSDYPKWSNRAITGQNTNQSWGADKLEKQGYVASWDGKWGHEITSKLCLLQ